MFNRKKNTHVSIEINDYVLRSLVMKGPDFSQAKVYEIEIPNGVIEESVMKDEMELFEIFREYAPEWGGKKQRVRFLVPDSTVLLKAFEHPSDVEQDKLREFVEMELGHSIHLPFDEPLIDVYDPKEGDGKAMLFAANSEEVNTYMNLFLDVHMEPEVADVRGLCILRLLQSMDMLDPNKTYILTNWLINELSVLIYSKGQVDFLRFQPIATDLKRWEADKSEEGEIDFIFTGEKDDYQMEIADQVLELEKIMNFFRFSLNKGDKVIDEIIVTGDNPNLDVIHSYLQSSLDVSVRLIDDEVIQAHYPNFKAKHASLLGLALKEVDV